jgi:hypothetical protein
MLKDKLRLLRRAPLRVSLIVLAGLCASLGLFAPTASAAPLSSHPRAATAASSGKSSSAAGYIICTVNVDNPHHSGHNPGTAGAQAQTTLHCASYEPPNVDRPVVVRVLPGLKDRANQRCEL